MKRAILIIALLMSMLLSGCSLLGEVNQSLEYVNEATEYMNQLSNFAEEVPQLIQEATVSTEAVDELETQLTNIIQQIEAFNGIEPPSIAKDIHQQLVSKNELLIEEINKVMVNGELLIDQLENSQIVETINQITTLQNQLEELGL